MCVCWQSEHPHVIEPAIGLGRLLLAVLSDAYVEEELVNECAFARTLLQPPLPLDTD